MNLSRRYMKKTGIVLSFIGLIIIVLIISIPISNDTSFQESRSFDKLQNLRNYNFSYTNFIFIDR